MQIPIRKSERSRRYPDTGGPVHLTAAGIKHLEDTLRNLEKQLPQAIAEVQRTGAMGDFSENAAYQDAKGRLRRLHSRIAVSKDQINRAQVIGGGNDWHPTGAIRLGSRITLKINGTQKIYELVGPAETDPPRGRISHLSPLGAALLDRKVGDKGELKTENTRVNFEIIRVE